MGKNWLSELRKTLICSCAALLATAGATRAQQALPADIALPPAAPAAAAAPGDVQAQLLAQQKEIEELKEMIRSGQIKPANAEAADPAKPVDEAQVKKILDSYLKEKDEKKKKDDDEKAKNANDEGYKVGTDLKMTARWNPTSGATFETANKDFTFHAGYRFQLDNVYFDQDSNLKKAPAAGIGDLQDGIFFRRSRPSFDGTAWEVIEFNCELALEQIQASVPNFDEVWVGITKIPVVGTVRIGHLKVPQGFEGDQVSSSKAMTFLERSSYTDAFYENFGTGIWTGNSVLDQRMTWSGMAYRQDNPRTNSAADFGDGEYAYSGRVTWLPFWECEGRHWVHVGASATWRNNERPDPGLADPRTARFRARPEMRDAIGDFGNGVLPGDTNRLVDTGTIFSDSTAVLGAEFCGVWGPFSLQAEYGQAYSPDARTVVRGPNLGTLSFEGGYVQVSYFLTGENRTYDRRLGRLGSTYIASPYTPFWSVRGEDGHLSWGPGAWEVAARLSRVNLNDAPVRGGVEDGLEAAVNWYLNTNLKIQFEYLHNNRYDLKPGVLPGSLDGLGIRTQIFF